MTQSRYPTPPDRMAQTSEDFATLFTCAEAEYRKHLDEPSAWNLLEPRLIASRGRHRGRVGYLTAFAVAASFVLAWYGWQRNRPNLGHRQRDVATSAELDSRLATTNLQLVTGNNRLPDGTEVDLNEGAQGTFKSNAKRATVSFDRGRLDIGVTPQPKGRIFAVEVQGYEFRVVGTRFTVTTIGTRVELDVAEGRVEVRDAMNKLRTVGAGDHWSNQDPVPEAPISGTFALDAGAPPLNRSTQTPGTTKPEGAAGTSDTRSSDASACRDLLHAGKARASEHCYLAVAAGGGLSAEMALYEVARLRRDVLSEPQAALRALNDYESRFAFGTLAHEVHVARIDLLARIGQFDEALRASDALLSNSIGQSRMVELRLLRGNLLRDKRGDCNKALVEYGSIESDPGPRGDQAQFARADCLERLGRFDEARRGYLRYLERPKPQLAERARQRLAGLSQ